MPSKHHPDYRYIRKVKPLRVHLFTLIQIICIAILWVVKSTSIAIAFPFFLGKSIMTHIIWHYIVYSVLCVPARIYLLPLIFTNTELAEIDNETLEDLYDDHDDAYKESHRIPSQPNFSNQQQPAGEKKCE